MSLVESEVWFSNPLIPWDQNRLLGPDGYSSVSARDRSKIYDGTLKPKFPENVEWFFGIVITETRDEYGVGYFEVQNRETGEILNLDDFSIVPIGEKTGPRHYFHVISLQRKILRENSKEQADVNLENSERADVDKLLNPNSALVQIAFISSQLSDDKPDESIINASIADRQTLLQTLINRQDAQILPLGFRKKDKVIQVKIKFRNIESVDQTGFVLSCINNEITVEEEFGSAVFTIDNPFNVMPQNRFLAKMFKLEMQKEQRRLAVERRNFSNPDDASNPTGTSAQDEEVAVGSQESTQSIQRLRQLHKLNRIVKEAEATNWFVPPDESVEVVENIGPTSDSERQLLLELDNPDTINQAREALYSQNSKVSSILVGMETEPGSFAEKIQRIWVDSADSSRGEMFLQKLPLILNDCRFAAEQLKKESERLDKRYLVASDLCKRATSRLKRGSMPKKDQYIGLIETRKDIEPRIRFVKYSKFSKACNGDKAYVLQSLVVLTMQNYAKILKVKNALVGEYSKEAQEAQDKARREAALSLKMKAKEQTPIVTMI